MQAFILSLLNSMDIAEMWGAFREMNTAVQIILGVVVFALVATILYFVFRFLDGIFVIFKGIWWLCFNTVRLALFLATVLAYSVFWLLILLPMGFFKYKKFPEIFSKYRNALLQIRFAFYPKSKKDIILSKEEIEAKKAKESATKPTEKKKKSGSAKEAHKTEADEAGESKNEEQEIPPETPPSSDGGHEDNAAEDPATGEVFHCSNCGVKMMARMVEILKEGNPAFCDNCGQKYLMEGGRPYPTKN